MGALRVGVVGVGSMGQNHARIYTKMGVLGGISDIDEERRKGTALRHACPVAVADYRDLASTVDAVSIATPATTHHEIAGFFLKRNIHVLVEKPMAATVMEAQDLVRLAHKHGKVLMVGHVDRYNPAIREIHRTIKRARWIEVFRVSPFPRRNADVDVVLDVMIHGLDFIHEITGRTWPGEIRAWGMPVLFGHDDVATAWLEWPSYGIGAHLTANRVADQSIREIRVLGTDMFGFWKYISVDALAMSVTVRGISSELGNVLGDLHGGGNPPLSDVISIPYKLYWVDKRDFKDIEPLEMELEHFIDCVKRGEVLGDSLDRDLEVMMLADRVRNVMDKNRELLRASGWHQPRG